MTAFVRTQLDLAGARILVVDDVLENRKVLCQLLGGKGYDVSSVPDGETALEAARTDLPDLILLDVTMPGIDGYEVCRRLKQDPRTQPIPVLFITAHNEIGSLMKGFQVGGVDYLTKPIQAEEVLVRVETHLKLKLLTQSLLAKNEELQQEVICRKQAEQAADRANQAKTQFLSFISHEMRSPLNAIIGYSEMVCEELSAQGDARCREDVSRICSSSKYLLGLINNLLDLSKIEAGKMPVLVEQFDVLRLVEDVRKDLRPLIERNGDTLEVIVSGIEGPIRADLTKTRQVLTNLITNACKFTAQGVVTVRLARADDVPQRLRIDVTDTGIGMSAEELGRLFAPYTQASAATSRQYGGTGLGLAISKRFCQLMGGDLTAASEPGKGSTFTVVLPVDVRPETA
jgi:signal transduction histidine kinase